MIESIRKADILVEAIPYIHAFREKVIVAKYGGSAIDNAAAIRGILQDLVFLSAVGSRPILVHGGGPEITRKLSASGKRSRFIDGMRVTDRETVRVVNQALEEVNRRLVAQVKSLGGHAEGIVASDAVIVAQPHPRAAELGFVGSVKTVRLAPIHEVLSRPGIPVLSPVGVGEGQLYNVNADEVASEVAIHLKAEKLVLLTNVRGILRHPNDDGSLISTLSVKQTRLLLERRVIQEGMIPKVKACVEALRRGVKKTHIIDATISHAMLLEIFTKTGIGTEIVR
ncbi:MAG: acetylglutamate kinase [Candidatus Omnitrophica bacterium]|nr:acetylglutamate kinase [Candidatus Omnitrophota bacterium]